MISFFGSNVASQMRDQADMPEPDELGPAEPTPPHDDPRYLMFKMKKRRQAAILKRMLIEAGYGDLAKMASMTRDEIDDHHEER